MGTHIENLATDLLSGDIKGPVNSRDLLALVLLASACRVAMENSGYDLKMGRLPSYIDDTTDADITDLIMRLRE